MTDVTVIIDVHWEERSMLFSVPVHLLCQASESASKPSRTVHSGHNVITARD